MSNRILKKPDFDQLINTLLSNGYEVYGPQVKEDAIVFDVLHSASQFPQFYGDEQRAGQYRLNKNNNQRWFAWANTAQGIKPLLFSPSEQLWTATSHDGAIEFKATDSSYKPKAIIGVRNCDLVGLSLQDQHFLGQETIDPYYKARREQLLLIAVNCTHPSQSCFCDATGDGPIVKAGYDIVLDELDDAFAIKAASESGEVILDALPLTASHPTYDQQVAKQHDTVKNMSSADLPAINIQQALQKNADSAHWDEWTKKCLACGNCTAVCPSCFCYSEHDVPALDGNSSQHIRQWDSCFNQSHSYIHGIVIRSEIKFRYRQWLTHKFSFWHDQYGRSGCSGCGRCITWCPVGIDVREAISEVCND